MLEDNDHLVNVTEESKPVVPNHPPRHQHMPITRDNSRKEKVLSRNRSKTGGTQQSEGNRQQFNRSKSGRSDRRPQPGGGQTARYSSFAREPLWPVSSPPRQQQVAIANLSSGASLTTPYGRDPYRINKTEALILEYALVNWGTFTNRTASADPGAAQCGARILQVFAEIVDVINFNGRFIPQQTLATAADFSTYLNNYTVPFSIYYSLLCVLEGIDLNASFRSFAPGLSGQGNLDRVALGWRRLQKIPIPPKFVTEIEKLFGVFYSDVEDFAYVAHINTASNSTTVTDLTSATQVATLLTLAETLLASLEVTTAEAAQIGQTFGVVYGVPQPLPKPRVKTEQSLFDLHFCKAANYLVTALNSPCPISTALNAGGVIPVLRRRGQNDDNLFSYIRPAFYSYAGVLSSATSDISGLVTFASGSANYGRYYGPNAGANNTVLSETTFGAINYGNGSFFEVEWWAGLVQSAGIQGLWQNDSRSYDRWDEFYPTIQNIASNTVKRIDEIFLTDMSIRDLR